MLEWEKTETRYAMIQKVLPYLEKYTKQSVEIPVIIGGDFNSPSHLDWGEDTINIHNGLAVPWYSTKVLEDLGLNDSFRSLNPNPIAKPGITWDSKAKEDEHRIDYIFYKGNQIKAIKSDIYMAFFSENILINKKEIPCPSDHGFVVTTFKFVN